MKTQTEIIKETVQYYSEDVNRRAKEQKRCLYITDDKRMCAVGRCFTKIGLIEFYGVRSGFCYDRMFPFFKEEYKVGSENFWTELQDLHDNDYYWDKGGLTERGKKYVEYLLKEFGDERIF